MLKPRSCARKKQFPSSFGKGNSGLRTHFGYGNDQIRRGMAKLDEADCNGTMSRLKPEKIMLGGWTFVHRRLGKSFRIPAITKNIPVSNSTEMMCISMSPVPTGKLSRLSSCIKGESTAMSTIRTSTIFGVLRCIVFAAASWKSTGRFNWRLARTIAPR